jgi:hypothetical protein
MSSPLEKFMSNNRKDFDSENPSAKVWEDIEKNIPVKKNAKVFSIKDIYKWSAAAAVLFIALTSAYFLFIRKPATVETITKTEKASDSNTVNQNDIGTIAPEYAAEAKQFYRIIETKQQELKSITKDQPNLYNQFATDLSTLDSSYRVLKNQAAITPNRDVIIKAMMQNLQLQAELLSRQLMIINDFKNTKNQNDEKNNIQSL